MVVREEAVLQVLGFDSLPNIHSIWRPAWLTLIWLSGGSLFNQLLRWLVWDELVARAIGGPVPGALKALATVILYLVIATCIVGFVYERSVAGFLTALGAGGVVLGFALRDLLADVFTGLAINIDRTFAIGDWIHINEGVSGTTIGQINEIGWRCTSLTTEEKTNVLVPNSLLGRERMINITRPLEATRYEVTVSIEYSVSPRRVKRVLFASMQALQDIEGFDSSRPPVVLIKETSSLGVEYLLRFWILPWHPVSPTSAADLVFESALKHLHTAGIALAYPKTDIYTARMPIRQFDSHNEEDLAALLANIDLFSPLEKEDLDLIVKAMERRHLAAGATLFQQGDKGKTLFILIEGLLDVDVSHGDRAQRVAHIHPGECFGEMSLLTGDRRSATIRANSESIVYEVGKKPISRIMERRPALVETLSQVLAQRQLSTELMLNEADQRRKEEEIEGFASQLIERMRAFLEIRRQAHTHD
jgi:small-conductance mechanosensitive channel/CRP-like cAMP-binding protein